MTIRCAAGFFVVTHRLASKFRRPATAMNARTTLRKPTTAAFTLIELLAVIAIIAILMKLLFPVVISAKNQARRNEATLAAQAIVAACKNYATDGTYTAFTSSAAATIVSFGPKTKNTGVKGDQGDYDYDNSELFNVLRNIPSGMNANSKLNKRNQKYFEQNVAKDKKNPRSGFADGTGYPSYAPQGAFMDPWGTQYCIVLDATGADEISATDVHKYYSDFDTIRKGAISFSLGKDQILGTKENPKRFKGPSSSDTPDDAISW